MGAAPRDNKAGNSRGWHRARFATMAAHRPPRRCGLDHTDCPRCRSSSARDARESVGAAAGRTAPERIGLVGISAGPLPRPCIAARAAATRSGENSWMIHADSPDAPVTPLTSVVELSIIPSLLRRDSRTGKGSLWGAGKSSRERKSGFLKGGARKASDRSRNPEAPWNSMARARRARGAGRFFQASDTPNRENSLSAGSEGDILRSFSGWRRAIMISSSLKPTQPEVSHQSPESVRARKSKQTTDRPSVHRIAGVWKGKKSLVPGLSTRLDNHTERSP